MKYKTLQRYYRPENAVERQALHIAADRCGGYPECAQCKRRVASCEVIDIEYAAQVELLTAE